MITSYPAWLLRYKPQDADGRPIWPRFGRIAGYVDAFWMIQAHYIEPDPPPGRASKAAARRAKP